MDFLVESELNVPERTPESDVKQRESAEAAASADLARKGHLVRLWKPPVAPGEKKAVGLYRAETEAPHPNNPTHTRASLFQLPDPRLIPVVVHVDTRVRWSGRSGRAAVDQARPVLDLL